MLSLLSALLVAASATCFERALEGSDLRAGVKERPTPSPPTKSFDFRGFDSSKLLILKGGNCHVRMIL